MKKSEPTTTTTTTVVTPPTVMPEPPTKEETPGTISFFKRYWQFVLWGVISLALVLNNEVFKFLGALIYLPLLVFAVFILAFVVRHVLNKTSTDAYIHGDAYDTDFASLSARDKCFLTQAQFAIYIIVIALLASKVMGSEPTLQQRFDSTEIRPQWNTRLDVIIAGIVRDKERYVAIQKMRPNGMPWFVVAGIHERESSRNFTRHLHEGSPLIHQTYYVPKNRPKFPPPPPFTFEQSAEDALYILKHEDWVKWCDLNKALDAIENYNGLGYRKYHPNVPSPYLWSGTNSYSRGKYIADGRFSPTAIDKQPGVAALWLRMLERKLL